MGAAGHRRIAITLACTAALAAGCFGDDLPTVDVEPVTRTSVTERISAPATVQAAARQEVAATVPGVVAGLRRHGSRVDAGAVVARLTSAEVDRAIRQAKKARAAARVPSRATTSRPLDVPAGSVPDIDVPAPGRATRAATRQAVAELDAEVGPELARARKQLRRIEEPGQRAAAGRAVAAIEAATAAVGEALLAAGAAAAAQQDAMAAAVTASLNQAVAEVSAAQRAQATALARASDAQAGAVAAARRAEARAARAQAAAALTAARARKAELRLTAPIAGIVQLGNTGTPPAAELPDELGVQLPGTAPLVPPPPAEEGARIRRGDRVHPGQRIFTVYDLSTLYVRADVDELDLPALERGQRARIRIDAFPDEQYEGVVEHIGLEPTTSPAGGVTYAVRIRLLDMSRDARPRIGMTASAEIATRRVADRLSVPSRAIVRRGDRTAVYAYRGRHVDIVPVQVLALGEFLAAVEGDLAEGDQVVVSGYEDLSDGAEVRTE